MYRAVPIEAADMYVRCPESERSRNVLCVRIQAGRRAPARPHDEGRIQPLLLTARYDISVCRACIAGSVRRHGANVDHD